MTQGFKTPGDTRPLPAVRPTRDSRPAPEVFPYHTKAGATLWLTQGEIDQMRLREFASTETGEIGYLAAMDFGGDGSPRYPPTDIPDIIEKIDREADIRTKCRAEREKAKQNKGKQVDAMTRQWG